MAKKIESQKKQSAKPVEPSPGQDAISQERRIREEVARGLSANVTEERRQHVAFTVERIASQLGAIGDATDQICNELSANALRSQATAALQVAGELLHVAGMLDVIEAAEGFAERTCDFAEYLDSESGRRDSAYLASTGLVEVAS